MAKQLTRDLNPPAWMGAKGRLVWKILPMLMNLKLLRLIAQTITRFTIESTSESKIGNHVFKLSSANPRLDMRINTYATKEPETLKWIDGLEQGSVLWDIGANIGLYSLYAAKSRQCRVIAFEPSVFCLEFLARNIWMNDLQNLISIVPNPLSNETKINLLTLSSREWGESSNSFGTKLNQDGVEIRQSLDYQVLGMTLDHMITKLGLQKPNHIKIDVDGIEPIILSGGTNLLKDVDSVSIEVPTYSGANTEVSDILIGAGLTLEHQHGNQIWRRNPA
jgi:FkbM family methyltransferase